MSFELRLNAVYIAQPHACVSVRVRTYVGVCCSPVLHIKTLNLIKVLEQAYELEFKRHVFTYNIQQTSD